MDTVLFACVHDAGRSQMAAAWFNKLCDPTKARALSAGIHPGERVHPEVVQVMREKGRFPKPPALCLAAAVFRCSHLSAPTRRASSLEPSVDAASFDPDLATKKGQVGPQFGP